MALVSGEKLGPYEIIDLLGAGGMGEVYRARDTRLNREVAVKILPPQYSGDDERIRRFEQEARSTGMLNHPNIISIHDVGNTNGSVYVVTELLSGETLRERLGGSALPLRKGIEFGLQLAHGLAAAHEKGLIHRDLKPENIFITRDGRVKILDFGLAKLAAPDEKNVSVLQTLDPGTRPGVVLGTVGYMSPEQVRGRTVDHRSDIFSCGAILYEMFTGKRAFHRDSTADTMSAILKEDPPDLSQSGVGIPPALEKVVRHCLEKNPEERFQSARDLAFDLEMVSGVSGTAAAPASPQQVRRRPSQVVLGLVALAVVAAAFVVGRMTAPRAAISRNTATSDSAYRRLTFQRGFITSARFTADGQSVLFSAAWGGGPEEIFTTRPQNAVSRSLGIQNATLLAVSKNNEMAVLLKPRYILGWERVGMLARCPVDGGAPREIVDNVQDADWAPDGSNLAIAHPAGAEYVLEYPIGKVVYRTPGWIDYVRISPAGDRIAFLQHDQPGDDRGLVAMVDVNGNVQRLTSEFASATGLHWSLDGKEIWFSASKGGSNEQPVYAVNQNKELRVVAAMLGNVVLEDIFSNGTALLSRDNRRREMFIVTPKDPREREFSWLDWSFPRGLSADGKWVSFEEEGVGGGPNYTVYLRNTDGSPAIKLGEGVSGPISPDGKFILSQIPSVDSKFTLLPTGAGTSKTVSVRGALQAFGIGSWFNDGRRILLAIAMPGKPPGWCVIDTVTNAVKPITVPGPASTALITPDQNGVLAMNSDDGSTILYDLTGKEIRRIQLTPGTLMSYADDGASVYILETSGLPLRILRVNTVSGKSETWREITPSDLSGIAGGFYVLITPDGGTYVYTFRRVLSDLYLASDLR